MPSAIGVTHARKSPWSGRSETTSRRGLPPPRKKTSRQVEAGSVSSVDGAPRAVSHTPPAPTATFCGAARRATTRARLVSGSIAWTVPVTSLVTQTRPAPNATPRTPSSSGIAAAPARGRDSRAIRCRRPGPRPRRIRRPPRPRSGSRPAISTRRATPFVIGSIRAIPGASTGRRTARRPRRPPRRPRRSRR